MTPTPSPSPVPGADDVNWTDVVSALSDAVVAIGTLGTLLLIVVTVRQQGRALGLQIEQLQHERDAREAAQRQAEQESRQRQLGEARRVRISTYEIEYRGGTIPLVHSLDTATELMQDIWHRQAGSGVAGAVEVKNGSDMVVRNLSFHADSLQRPQYIYREGATVLMQAYELDRLAPEAEATFIWPDINEQALHDAGLKMHFSDEDGRRWAVDLHAHTIRIDHLE
ncbi:hypothetical protein [Nonomuraea sp. NPDC050202]|uniref:hypothetical protein n=1 Tax=Nonomuraea sp. NPDC050202 TaxID=3155035 RepID=UPI0033F16A26